MSNPCISTIELNRELVRTAIAPYLKNEKSYSLLDFPAHSNVGDSLIWLGELNLFREITGGAPAYTCTAHDFKPELLRRLSPSGPIFLHGGGNLGDLYPLHMDLRAKVAEAFPDRTIVQLPQSIHFVAGAEATRFRTLVKNHGAFKLMVRDRPSLIFANEQLALDDATLVPDCAFGMAPISPDGEPEMDYLYMMRDDVEKVKFDVQRLATEFPGPVEDWLQEPSDTTRRSVGTLISLIKSGIISWEQLRMRHRDDVALRRAKRGISQLSKSRVIVSDRLHVHILSLLLGKEHIALDNSYRKIHNFADVWTSNCSLVRMANTVEEVQWHLRELRT